MIDIRDLKLKYWCRKSLVSLIFVSNITKTELSDNTWPVVATQPISIIVQIMNGAPKTHCRIMCNFVAVTNVINKLKI